MRRWRAARKKQNGVSPPQPLHLEQRAHLRQVPQQPLGQHHGAEVQPLRGARRHHVAQLVHQRAQRQVPPLHVLAQQTHGGRAPQAGLQRQVAHRAAHEPQEVVVLLGRHGVGQHVAAQLVVQAGRRKGGWGAVFKSANAVSVQCQDPVFKKKYPAGAYVGEDATASVAPAYGALLKSRAFRRVYFIKSPPPLWVRKAPPPPPPTAPSPAGSYRRGMHGC